MKPQRLLCVLLTVTCLHATASEPTPTVSLTVPAANTLPAGPLGASIASGRDALQNTGQRLPVFVGSGLSCKNCHLGNGTEVGTEANSAPFVGVMARYPQYSARHGAVITLEQRINDCFQRSLNGRPLPLDHPALVDMVAYMTWLSQGVPVGANVAGQGIPPLQLNQPADTARGEAVYQAKCQACHGADGGGTQGADGGYLFPPLWGPQSFNSGAGMTRHATAAGFIKHKMPRGAGDTLTDDEAWDVAAFILSKPRPTFTGQE